MEIVILGSNPSCSACWLCGLKQVATLFVTSASLAVKVKATYGPLIVWAWTRKSQATHSSPKDCHLGQLGNAVRTTGNIWEALLVSGSP